jgi:bacillithiol synthase
MPNDCVTYQNSGYYSKLIIDYLNQKEELLSLYDRFPTLENFKFQIEEKEQNFPFENRITLVNSLKNQCQNITLSEACEKNINSLSSKKTFTVTTGHQLNLFTGPLYFLYKIVSVINLTKQLKQEYPNYNFVPVYWMATEDHDFEEINYFNLYDKKIKWNRESNGPVGRLSTEGLNDVFDVFSKELGIGNNANYLKELFRKSYLENNNLADATRFLVNELFASEGLVIIDGDDKELKKLLIPYCKEELLKQTSYKEVNKVLPLLKEYNIQVNPREINLFYIEDNLRERIVFENNIYQVLNTNYSFTENEILMELENNPEKFSPNVILRPLYQEVVLPNLCYIGGGGEIAYWLELKSNFEANKVTFPILLLRNSVLLVSEKQALKADKLELTWNDIFLSTTNLKMKKTKDLSNQTIDFTLQKEHLKKQFEDLYRIAKQTDNSFLGAVKAQEVKQIKGLENLEKRLLKAEKRVYTEKLERIITLQNELFPNNSLQERVVNFSDLNNSIDIKKLIGLLLEKIVYFDNEFKILKI